MIVLLCALAGVSPAAYVASVPSVSELAAWQDPAPSATPAAQEKKEPKWTGSVAAGGKIASGNSETRTGNATADAELRRENDRYSLGFLWVYDENRNNPLNDWTLTDRKTAGKAQYDYFFSKKTYGLANAALQSDLLADVDLRQIYGVGLGRQLREDEKLKLGAELGLSYVDEDYGNSPDADFLAARGAYKLDWTISKVLNFGQDGQVLPSLEDSDDVLAQLDTRLKATFTESFFGQLQWLYLWDSSPAAGKERQDNQWLLSIGWKF